MRGLKQAIHLDRVIDVSGVAEHEGFLMPVGLSRRLYESAVLVWSHCACNDCEQAATNATRDRIIRLLRSLRDAIATLDDTSTIVEFSLDTPTNDRKAKSKRQVWTLRASLGPAEAEDPVVTVTLHNEEYLTPLTSFRPTPKGVNA